jgi:hypothetical protein
MKSPSAGATKNNSKRSGQRSDKRQIEQRIEEDRERHKRLREGGWAIPKEPAGAEMTSLWDVTTELDADDYRLMNEQFGEYRATTLRTMRPH